MNPVLVVLDSLFDDLSIERAAAVRQGWALERWNDDEDRLARAAAVVHVRTRIDDGLLARMPRCRVVGRFGTGLDTVDVDAANQRGVSVVAVRDYCIPELTAHTLGMAFALERRIDAARDGRLRPEATWQEVAERLPIPGRTDAAVIGYGAVGSAVTRALVAANYRVRVVTRHGAADAAVAGAEPVTLDGALATSSVVFLHVALTRDTVRSVNAGWLARMRRDAILVDTARIGLLDEAAVAAEIANGALGGLALDARVNPASPLWPLLDDPRVLVTPHIGWYSERSARVLRERTVTQTIDAAAGVLGGPRIRAAAAREVRSGG